MTNEQLAIWIEQEMKLAGAADVTLKRVQWERVCAALRLEAKDAAREEALLQAPPVDAAVPQ